MIEFIITLVILGIAFTTVLARKEFKKKYKLKTDDIEMQPLNTTTMK